MSVSDARLHRARLKPWQFILIVALSILSILADINNFAVAKVQGEVGNFFHTVFRYSNSPYKCTHTTVGGKIEYEYNQSVKHSELIKYSILL